MATTNNATSNGLDFIFSGSSPPQITVFGDARAVVACLCRQYAAAKYVTSYVKDRSLEFTNGVFDFTEKWICCSGVDDDSVVENVRRIGDMQDGLAEEYLEFNHQAKRRHYTTQHPVIDIVDNGQPEMVMAEPAADTLIGPNGQTAQMATAMVGTTQPTHIVIGDVMVPIITDDAIVVYGAVLPDGQGLTGIPAEMQDAQQGNHLPGSEARGDEDPTLVYTICHDVIEVKNSRRVATNGRHFYNAAVVAEIKNKLGLTKPTEANKLVVRRMARNIMEKHGVRPTHIRQSIEKVVAGVFVPDQYDIEASAMLSSNAVANLRSQVDDSGPKNGWSTVKDLFRFGWRRKQASRVPPVAGLP